MALTLQAYEGNLIFERDGKKNPQRYIVVAKSELEAKEYFRAKFETEKMIIEGVQTVSTPQGLQEGNVILSSVMSLPDPAVKLR